MKSISKRIPFVCSAQTGSELQAGSRDVANIYNVLIDSKLGNCESKGFNPIYDCPSRSEFERSLLAILNSWKIHDQLVFYFSGHGEFKREQYCLKFGENDLYPIKNLLNELEANGVNRAILIIDACRSAAVIGDKGFNEFDLENINIPRGIALIASCRANETSQELIDGSSSVFTHLFCTGIQTGLGAKQTGNQFITVEDIIDYLYDELEKPEYQRYKQRPVYKTDKAEGAIWIAKNQSFRGKQGSATNQENIISNSFLSNDSHLNYDRQIVQLYTIEHLDDNVITSFLEQPSAKQELRRSGLLRASRQEHLSLLGFVKDNKPTLGAFLCFATKGLLADKYAACSLHFAVYSDSKRSSSTSSPDVIKDNLLNLFELGMEFFSTHAGLQRTGYIGTERRDDLEIPEIALREALANALVHRDYEDPALKDQPTRIDVYSDRIEITSYGSLLGGITEKDLNEQPEDLTPFRRNHIIADIFRIMQRVELNASGVSRMHEATKLANLSPPEIKIPKNQVLKVIFNRPTNRHFSISIPHNLPRSGVVDFVGREEKLKQLHSQLYQSDRIAITAIAGMGGIGKTELALQYAFTQLQQGTYPAGFCWLRARDQNIATQIVDFAKSHLGLSLSEKLTIDDQVIFCWHHWPVGEALIILDDVTDYQAITPYLPPVDTRFKLLITTRLDLGSTIQKIAIEELDEDSAIALLESFVGEERVRSQLDESQALCKWVGYLPLALELLGRFLARKADWSFNKLLKSLENKRLETKALITRETGMTGQLGVTAALELSWQELNESEQELACVLGMFAISPIPWSIVENCLSYVDPDDLESTRDDGLMARCVLKRVGDETYQLHQIVQEYFRTKLHQRGDRGQDIKDNFRQVVVKIARAIDQTLTIDRIERVRYAIIHLEEGIKKWVDSFTTEDLIWLFVGIGRFYEGLGNYRFAEPWFRDCLEVTRVRLGVEHPSVAASLNNLAGLYHAQGRYEEAEPLYLSALEMYKRLLGEEHPLVATNLNNLAGLYESQGRYEEAEPLYLSALEMYKRLLGEENPSVAAILNNLALLYQSQGKYERVEPLYRSALEKRMCLLGEEHIDVAMSLNNLAGLYQSQGKYEEAEPLYRLALEKRMRLLGAKHPDVATSLNNLAALYYAQGKYDEAEPLYRSALDMRMRLLGAKHPDVATSLNNLAALYYAQGKYDEAEPLYRLALDMRKNLLEEEHPDVATSLNNLALLYQSQGRYGEAEPFYRLALKMRTHLLGAEHLDVATSLNNLAALYYAQGKYDEAEPLYLSALEMYKHLLGSEHLSVATSQWSLGVLYQKQGMYNNSETLYSQALSIAEARLGFNHPLTQNILSWLKSLPKFAE